MSHLMPCPFCGSDDVGEGYDRSKAGWYVGCFNCDAQICPHHATMEEAWEFWNTRPNSWQPIETAPKDGTVVIVGRDMGDPWGFVRGYGHFESHAGISGWVCEGFIDPPGNLGLGNPDCWMELPGQRPPEAA